MQTPGVDFPFPPDPNPRKPRLHVPAGSWDSHFHVYGTAAAPVEHWLRVSAALGIERGVVVMPGMHGTDPAVTLDAIARSGGRIRGMIRADANLTASDVARLHTAGIRGLRFPFARALGRDFNEDVVHANVACIAAAGWFVEFQIDGDMLDVHADLIANLPMPTLIDAFAGIEPNAGLDQPAFRTLLDVMDRPNLYLKHTGADRLLHEGQRFDAIVAMTRALIERAPDRVVWGSDWPHSYVFEAGRVPNDGDLIDLLLDFAPDPAVRRKILVDNPRRLFDFD